MNYLYNVIPLSFKLYCHDMKLTHIFFCRPFVSLKLTLQLKVLDRLLKKVKLLFRTMRIMVMMVKKEAWGLICQLNIVIGL